METLARIDTVAYVRFASVYKNFQEADDFDKFVSELRPNEKDKAKSEE
jgi:transcriptional repressor NrdR